MAFRYIVSQRLILERTAMPRRRHRNSEIHDAHTRVRRKGEGEGKTLLDAMRDGATEGCRTLTVNSTHDPRRRHRSGDRAWLASNAGNLRLELAAFRGELRNTIEYGGTLFPTAEALCAVLRWPIPSLPLVPPTPLSFPEVV